MPVESGRGSARSGRSSRVKVILIIVLGFVIALPAAALAGEDHVTDLFHRLSDTSKVRPDGSKIPPDHVRVDETVLSDGHRASLWVSNPALVNQYGDRCWYLQLTTSESRYVGGIAACGSNDEESWLRRSLGALVGKVGPPSVAYVGVTSSLSDVSERVQVIGGFYLVPAQYNLPNTEWLAVSYYDARGELISTTNLTVS